MSKNAGGGYIARERRGLRARQIKIALLIFGFRILMILVARRLSSFRTPATSNWHLPVSLSLSLFLPTARMPLQQSLPITRCQLAALSGGKMDRPEGRRHSNPLGLATPMTYCGGAALASYQGIIAHITIKEENNLPLPDNDDEIMELYKIAPSNGQLVGRPVVLLQQKNPQQKSIPFFWEPIKQPQLTKSTKERIGSGKRVVYVGHWEVVSLEVKRFRYLGIDRCAIIRLRLDRFDENFAAIIAAACEKTCNGIAKLDLTALTSARAVVTKKRKVSSSPQKIIAPPTKRSSGSRNAQQRSCWTECSDKPKASTEGSFCSRVHDKTRAAPRDPAGRKQNRAIAVPLYRKISLNERDDEGRSAADFRSLHSASKKEVRAQRKTAPPLSRDTVADPEVVDLTGATIKVRRKQPPSGDSAKPEVLDLTQSDDDDNSHHNGFDTAVWAHSRKRPARKSIPKKQTKPFPVATAQRGTASPSPSLTAVASATTVASKNDPTTVASNSETSSEGAESKLPAMTFFRIIVQGVQDEIGQSVGVHHSDPSGADITFQIVREAIENQLVPHRFGENLNWLFVSTLGRIYPTQEGWEVLSETDKKKRGENKKGNAWNPFEMTIEIVKVEKQS